MKCKRCSTEIEDTNISGYCGYCAYKAYKESSDSKRESIEGVLNPRPAAAVGGASQPAPRPGLASSTVPAQTERPLPRPMTVGSGSSMPGSAMPAPPSVHGMAASPSRAEEIVNNAYDPEVEQLLLNAFIKDRYVLSKVVEEGFQADMFASKHARRIGDCVMELYSDKAASNIIDRHIILDRLRKKGLLTDETSDYLDQILRHGTAQYAQATQYVDLIKERVAREQLEKVAERLGNYVQRSGEDFDKDPMDVTAEVIKSLQDLQKKNQEKKVRLIKEQMFQIVKAVNDREATGEIENLGYSIKPFYDLNTTLSGFRKGFLYGIAGAPRRGKTSLTLELATCVAANERVPVLFITWEQTKLNLTYRLLAKESQLNPDTLQRKRIMSNEEQEAKFAMGWRKMEQYMDYFYLVEGTKKDTIEKVKAHAYNIKQLHETDDLLIVVDYIQKMPTKNDIGDEKFKVEEISTQLKGLSIELNCPIVAISSLNKEGCNIDSEDSPVRPNMYHCKGSGDIEYDLDSAVIMAKDWGDTRELATQLSAKAEEMGKDAVNIPKIDVINIHIDKNRDAPEGISSIVQLLFLIENNKFIELGYKVETDHYRFTKIENLINKLLEEDYISFRDIESASSGDSEMARRKKIRLRY
ncbi:MAG: hypothetical protein CVV64_01260 [Candidatus Wallbacteria bacterium HGW-Wallbacteria-1]|jgi:replicative DNA helicase|uniref:DNA 5'-3' helicase n=1 Tax=Candidatus Wallbacteria bacterium HGW-Wallbacteria-1 TaxID=2013854 RepID=A0A2N1PUQ4_9BACT|nr:MAG: hypothetical protein CVV64_01260 [Candidatus Wallbacteria bacterium HGW-Wallbacteria-1]